MRNFSTFFLSLLFFLAFPLTFSGQTLSADNDGDGCVGTPDLLTLLSQFGECSSSFTCGDLISHDGYDYSTVLIGDQCWFSENCRYLPSVSPTSVGSEWNETTPYYYVYGYEGTDVTAAQATSNYATYGVLYNWLAVMTEGICPSGWHISSDGEFTELTDFLGGEDVAGDALKSISGWANNTNGSNSSGWTGLPGGVRYFSGGFSAGFDNEGSNGYWWSASESESGSYSWVRAVFNGGDVVHRYINDRFYGYSARCVRD